MPGGDAPAPPDYQAAAREQGRQNLLASIQSAYANNPNVFNPYGSQNVTWKIQRDKSGNITSAIPTINQKLSAAQKKIYDKGLVQKTALSDAGITRAKNIRNQRALNFQGLQQVAGGEKTRNDVIAAMMSRVNDDVNKDRQQQNSDLIAAGIRPGTAAYETAMDRINRGYNDARNAAILSGGQEASRVQGQNLAARQQGISDRLTLRQQPINEISALQSGSQINNPFAGNLGFQPGTNIQASPTFAGTQAQGQAQQNAYNQQQAAYNNNVAAGAGLLGNAAQIYFGR